MSLLRKKVGELLRICNNLVLWASLGLGLALLIIACGDTTATVNPAITQTGSISGATITAPPLMTIVQPKIIRTASDSYRKNIQFTEQPANLSDGIPSFLWFDAEG